MDSSEGGAAVTGAGQGAAAGAATGNPWGIAIGAGIGLIGGLMSARGAKQAEERRKKLELQMQGFQTQANAAHDWTQGSQNAFAQLMNGYGRITGG